MIDDIITSEGIKVVGLVRLTFFAPFGITSYILGVTNISVMDYMLGNITYIFNSCTQCFIGCSLYTAVQHHPGEKGAEIKAESSSGSHWAFIIEILLTIIVTIFIGHIAKNILERKLEEREAME